MRPNKSKLVRVPPPLVRTSGSRFDPAAMPRMFDYWWAEPEVGNLTVPGRAAQNAPGFDMRCASYCGC
ncbi:hypothetical protein RRG08_014404 [Elysia crispata]|uniref:Uncharacterized protein n=1 Tax=Elysia crispata TaxID=231223 RepID=A0AAE0YVG4_9GAST|nr:hypothetical protein RRG08_014404 [Elysia crispata]